MKIRTYILAVALSAIAPALVLAQTAPAATTSTAADADGIWAVPNASIQQQQLASYFSIRAAQSGLLVLIRLGSYDWQAFVTTLNGNSATVTTLTTQAMNSWRIDFISAEKATITGMLCITNGSGIQPLAANPTAGSIPGTDAVGIPVSTGNRCLVPQGTVLTLTKVV